MGTLGKDDLEFLVERVLERLRRPRVGLVACAPLPPLPGTDRFEWIAYVRGADGALEGVRRPEEEGAFLRLLAVLEPPLPLLRELLGGIPCTAEGALIFGCLARGVPVLLDGTRIDRWRGGASLWSAWLEGRLARLGEWGVQVLGTSAAGAVAPSGRTLVLKGPGWTTWGELTAQHDLRGVAAVRLGGGARLTPEARDRLARLRIALLD